MGGCVTGGTVDPTATPTPGDDRSPESAAGTSASIRDVTITPAVVALDSPDSIGTFGGPDEQYVVATVDLEGSSGPSIDSFALDAGGEAYPPTEQPGTYGGRLWEYDEPYDEESGGWIAFAVPKPLDAAGAAISWPDGERALADDAIERLERPPTDFEVSEFDAPDSVELGEEAVVRLTVENVGETDGTFVGALNRVGPWIAYAPAEALRIDVPAGETATRRHAHTPDDRGDREEIPPMTFHLNWRGDTVSRTVEVEPG